MPVIYFSVFIIYFPEFELHILFYRYQNGTNVVQSFGVSLKVGTKEFFGEAISAQAAKHNAAMNALKIIKVIHPDQKYFNVGPPKEDIFFDHHQWSIFQSSTCTLQNI